MDGHPDGFERMVKMDLIAMLGGTGKQENRRTGTDAHGYSMIFLKTQNIKIVIYGWVSSILISSDLSMSDVEN